MDRELSLRKNCGDHNLGQRPGESPSGSRGPAGLTRVTDPLRDLLLRTDQVGRIVRHSRRIVFCRRSRLGGDWKQCQSRWHDTKVMRSKEHRVGKQTRATVRYGKDRRLRYFLAGEATRNASGHS